MASYQRLNHQDRYFIHLCLQEERSVPEIAAALGKNPSTVYRELQRNSHKGHYDYVEASRLSATRRSRANTKICGRLLKAIIAGLQEDESPEQIAMYLKNHPELESISHAAIYNYIWRQFLEGGKLWRHLRFCGAKRRLRRYKGGARRAQLRKQATKRRIHERPESVNQRLHYGDWEMDLIEGAGRKRFLLVLVERKSRFIRACLLRSKHPREVIRKLARLMEGFRVHSITTDNGFEFGDGRLIEHTLGCPLYFTDAYASWQKGQVEHVNGLLRQYFPKKDSFIGATPYKVRCAATRINRRIRKSLDWSSPTEYCSLLQTT